MKYHINPETGAVSGCKAKIRCRFGGESGQDNHFPTEQAALQASEKLMRGKHPIASVKKGASFQDTRENIRRGLLAAGLLTSDDTLPEVKSEQEMVAKWFGGDRSKYQLIANIANGPNLKSNTKRSVGKLSEHFSVTMVDDVNFTPVPRNGSQIDLLGESTEEVTLGDIQSGRARAF